MRKLFLGVVVSLVTAARASAAEPAWAQALDDVLRLKADAGMSGAVFVEQNGEIAFAKAYGMANREKNIPWATETVYCLGSITKQFTAAAIVKLQSEGKLSVSDPLSKWVPNLEGDKLAITLHHLLTHSAGVPDGFGNDFDPTATRDWYLEQFRACKLLWGPEDFGKRYAYSNAGYSLLAMVVEEASGMAYETYLHEAFFEPLGMTRTGYFSNMWTPEDFAHGYRRDEDTGVVVLKHALPDGPDWNLRGNGGVCTTFADMRAWHHALIEHRVFDADSSRLFDTPFVSEGEGGDTFYSYGWSVALDDQGKLRYRGHNGGDGVSFADFRWYPGRQTLILIASTTFPVGLSNTVGKITQTIFADSAR